MGIVPGWLTDAEEWRQRLEEAMDQPYVLQRRIHPIRGAVPDRRRHDEWTLTWGAFLVAAATAGCSCAAAGIRTRRST